MKNTLADYFKIPHIFRDILYIMSGLLYLCIIDYYLKPNLDKFPNLNYIDEFERGILILSLAYFIGRLLIVIADIWEWLVVLFLKFITKQDYVGEMKRSYFLFQQFLNKSPHKIKVNPSDRSHDIDQCIENSRMLKDEYDRNNYNVLINGLLLGFSWGLAFILPSLFSAVLIFIFTVLSIKSKINFGSFRNQIADATQSSKSNLNK